MIGSTDKQARREGLERELREIRSTIRAMREATEGDQEHGLMIELERAEEREVQLLEALAELDADPDWTG